MTNEVLANLESFEGTAGSLTTLNLKRKSRKIVITNDHTTQDLRFKFNLSEEWGTLEGTESLSMYFTTKTIYLSGPDRPYRVWSFG